MYEIVCMKLQFYVILAFPTSSNRVEKEISCPTFPVVPNSALKVMDIYAGSFFIVKMGRCMHQTNARWADRRMDGLT